MASAYSPGTVNGASLTRRRPLFLPQTLRRLTHQRRARHVKCLCHLHTHTAVEPRPFTSSDIHRPPCHHRLHLLHPVPAVQGQSVTPPGGCGCQTESLPTVLEGGASGEYRSIRLRYYVNKNAQASGDHEVHELTCSFLPEEGNRIYLGDFAGCRAAVAAARKHYAQVNGCYFCSEPCHTG